MKWRIHRTLRAPATALPVQNRTWPSVLALGRPLFALQPASAGDELSHTLGKFLHEPALSIRWEGNSDSERPTYVERRGAWESSPGAPLPFPSTPSPVTGWALKKPALLAMCWAEEDSLSERVDGWRLDCGAGDLPRP